MADAKISALTAIDAVAAADLFAIVDDPAGTPVTKKATASQIKDYILGLANTWTAAQTISVNGAVSAPGFTGTGTWYTGGSATTTKPYALFEPAGTTSTGWSTSGTGLGVNAATGFAGRLIDLQVAGVSKASFNATGQFLSNTMPTIYNSSNVTYLCNASYQSNNGIAFTSTQLGLRLDLAFGWYSSDPSGTFDTALYRDAANTLALRNGTNAQTFRVYKTYTDASNYERLRAGYDTNIAYITSTAAGTGTARALRLYAGDENLGAGGYIQIGTSGAISFALSGTATWWQINASGHFLAGADNTYDIGASGATRPRTGYFGTSVITPLLTSTGGVTAFSGTAIPAGGTAGSGLTVSSTSNFGVFFGSGAPSLAAAKGSLYLRSDGSGTADRCYVNTDGSTTWTNLVTAA